MEVSNLIGGHLRRGDMLALALVQLQIQVSNFIAGGLKVSIQISSFIGGGLKQGVALGLVMFELLVQVFRFVDFAQSGVELLVFLFELLIDGSKSLGGF